MKFFPKVISILAAATFFIFFSVHPVGANEVPLITSEETSNSIKLSWNLEGETFKIYRDQELIWTGTQSEYTDTNLETDYLYGYRIGSYDKNNKLIDINNLKTKTKANGTRALSVDLSNEDYSTKLSSNVGSDFIRLEWDKLEDKDSIYDIHRDGELIGSTSELIYLDENLTPGESYTYTIEAKKEVSKEDKDLINSYLKENNLNLTKEEEEELYLKPHLLIRTIETNNEVTEQELKSKDLPSAMIKNEQEFLKANNSISPRAINYSFLFRYTTFIPEKTVSDPLSGFTSYLGGDNRSWGFFNNNYRTRSDVFAGWGGSATSELRQVPGTGTSIRYEDKAGTKEIDRAKASTADIKLTKDSVTTSKIQWRVNHSVGVPFLAIYPNIKYYYEGTLYNNYSVQLRGSHDKAPNHEFAFALAYTEDTPIKVFDYTGGSFFNLIPGVGVQVYFEYSI